MAALKEVDNKILGCHCHPNKCHADVLLKLRQEQRDMAKNLGNCNTTVMTTHETNLQSTILRTVKNTPASNTKQSTTVGVPSTSHVQRGHTDQQLASDSTQIGGRAELNKIIMDKVPTNIHLVLILSTLKLSLNFSRFNKVNQIL